MLKPPGAGSNTPQEKAKAPAGDRSEKRKRPKREIGLPRGKAPP